MDAVAYKQFHEGFMKNNNGTSIEDVFITIIPAYFTTFLATNFLFVVQPLGTVATFAIEFLFIVLPMILNLTVLNNRVWEITLTLLCVTLTAAAKQLYGRIHIAPFVQIPCRRPEYLSAVRANINLLTSICILAVDFKCFPRSLAKTETFGFGVMDTGVGLYVFGNGVVAPELFKSNFDNKLTRKKFATTVLSCVPLLVLGVARFFVINELDYQEHVSEYGVHWNFFLTLAFTKLFSTIIMGILPRIEYTKYAAMVLVTVHELCLQLGVSDYVIDTNNSIKRNGFVNANREGIFSIFGYVSIYLAAVYVGYMLKTENTVTTKNAKGEKNEDVTNNDNSLPEFTNVRQLFWKSVRLIFVSLVFWKIVYILKNMFGVSRRLANMGYVFWIMSIGSSITVCFMFLEILYYFLAFDRPTSDDAADEKGVSEIKPQATYIPMILDSISYNGLAFFLAANLLTGLINLSFQTFLLDTAAALIIICGYMLVLCAIMTFLLLNKIKLKAW